MRKKSVGEVLRAARESRDWSFAELQRMTKIQAKYLQALEYNDFEFIPDEAYTKSFIKRYAEALELDADVLVDAYERNSLVLFYEAGEEEGFELSRRAKLKKKTTSYLPLIYLLLSAGLIVIFVTYIVYNRMQHQTKNTEASSYTVVSSSSSSTDQTAEPSSEASSSSSSSSQVTSSLSVSGGGSALSVSVANASRPVTVRLSVTDVTSWVSLTDTAIAGGTVLSPEQQEVTVELPESAQTATLVLGVVQGVSIVIDGQALDTAALTSQTGTITITLQ